LILIVKKEDDNLDRLLDAFETKHPELRKKKVLIIDDEADYASVTARKKDGVIGVGRISGQIDHLRGLVADSAFLQVTATPYSLYLQPGDDLLVGGAPNTWAEISTSSATRMSTPPPTTSIKKFR
jgi:hypothetical protein